MLSSGGPALALVDLGLPPRPGLLPEPDAGLHLIDSLTGLRSKKDGSHYRHRFIVLTAATNYTQAVRRASELGVSPKSYLQKSPDVFESKLPEQVQLALQPGPKQRPRVELVLPTERVARIEGGEIPLERHLWCLLAAFAGGSRETGVLFPPRLQSIAGLALSLADGWAVDPLSKELIQTDGDIEEDDPEDEPDDPSGQHVSNTDPWPRLISGWVSKLRGRLDGAYRQAHHQGPPKNFIEKIGNGYRLNADILLLGEVKPGPEAHRFPVVLVVEDNEQWRSSISSDLERLGMRTKAVACIETARESVLSEPPDLISLDLELPLTEEELARSATDPANALAFLEFLGENFPDIPVAVLTGIAYRDSVMPRVLSEGVLECNYINKADPDSVAQLTTSLWRLWLGVLARTRILGANSNTPVHALHFDRLTGILTAVGPPSSPKPLRASGEGITILKRLSECPNVPVPRWVLFELVYPNDEATDMEQQGGDPENAFDKHVLRLRRVITQQTGIPGSEIVCGGRIGYYWLQGNAIWT
jgi:CheY-like chemotaxis protein